MMGCMHFKSDPNGVGVVGCFQNSADCTELMSCTKRCGPQPPKEGDTCKPEQIECDATSLVCDPGTKKCVKGTMCAMDSDCPGHLRCGLTLSNVKYCYPSCTNGTMPTDGLCTMGTCDAATLTCK